MTSTPTHERFTPGQTPEATAFMARRNLDSHGFFLAPLLQPGFHVLDAGCGPGTITNDIAEWVFPGRVTGLDTSAGQIERAQRLSQGRELVNARFIHASAYAMPFEDASFDLVFSHALLEHLTEPQRVLREFHRVTRPGGFAAVCSPDWDHFQIAPYPPEVADAIAAYRGLQENHGGNTQAGSMLARWTADAGFSPISTGQWMERYDSAQAIAGHIASQLEAAGKTRHAGSLRAWASRPDAEFHQSWRYTVAIKLGEEQ